MGQVRVTTVSLQWGAWMSSFEVRVREVTAAAQGIASFILEATDGSALPPYTAGAHIDVEAAPGVTRQYSLCGELSGGVWRIAVLKDPNSRGGSMAMHDRITAGSTLRVSQPRNLFQLQAAPHSLLIAGGIGITPILAMASELRRAGKPFELHYCARSPERMAFRDEMRAGEIAPCSRFYFDDAPDSGRFDVAGVLQAAPPGTHLYICGPSGFIDVVLETARKAGWAEDRLHREHFAAVIDTSGQGFTLKIAGRGQSIFVPDGTSALQALLAAGYDIPHSCEAGICGSCTLRVVDGIPDHRDICLSDADKTANAVFTPCCSRAMTSTLTIDIEASAH